MTTESNKNAATTLSRMGFSGHVGHMQWRTGFSKRP